MMTMDRRYCCTTVLSEPHDADCPTALAFSAPVLAATEMIDRWTPVQKESALRYLAGAMPGAIAEANGFLDLPRVHGVASVEDVIALRRGAPS